MSDEKLENMADFLLIVANDIKNIRATESAKENLALPPAENENETIADSTELSESGTQ